MTDAISESVEPTVDSETRHTKIILNDDRTDEARGRNLEAFPPGYWYSATFIGSFCATGFAFISATGSFALIAPILTEIDKEIGPDPNIAWVSIVNVLTSAVFFMLAGRLTDIFGRRYFFMLASAIGFVGCIVAATAKTVPQLIGAEVLTGSAAGAQLSFFWIISEIVPMNRRMLANAAMFLFSTPTNTVAPLVAYGFQYHTNIKWRGCFWLLMAMNVISFVCWFLFYRPPSFKMLHKYKTPLELVKKFDYIGLLLYSGGLVLLLMGLSWGGSLYPWKSTHVIVTVVIGGVSLIALALWEALTNQEEPYIPVHIVRNMRFLNAACLTGLATSPYYAFSLIWPQAVQVLYTNLSQNTSNTLSSVVPLCFVVGEILGEIAAHWIHPKPILIVTSIVGTGFVAAAGANPLNLNLTLSFIILGNIFVGAMDGVAIAMSTLPLESQEELGTAGGFSGSMRSSISAVATVIYRTILSNRLSRTVPNLVYPAATSAGLPTSSLEKLASGLAGNLEVNPQTIPGLTDSILRDASAAYKLANAQAYRTVFLSTLGIGGLGIIMSWFAVGVPKGQENFVAAHIHERGDAQKLEEGKQSG